MGGNLKNVSLLLHLIERFRVSGGSQVELFRLVQVLTKFIIIFQFGSNGELGILLRNVKRNIIK